MKKVFITLLGLTFMMSFAGCSTAGTASSGTQGVVSTVVQELLVNYLTTKLGSGTVLSDALSAAKPTSPLASILGGNSSNTNLLSDLISSQFSLPKPKVAEAVTNEGSTLGSLASFIGSNSSSSLLSKLLGINL